MKKTLEYLFVLMVVLSTACTGYLIFKSYPIGIKIFSEKTNLSPVSSRKKRIIEQKLPPLQKQNLNRCGIPKALEKGDYLLLAAGGTGASSLVANNNQSSITHVFVEENRTPVVLLISPYSRDVYIHTNPERNNIHAVVIIGGKTNVISDDKELFVVTTDNNHLVGCYARLDDQTNNINRDIKLIINRKIDMIYRPKNKGVIYFEGIDKIDQFYYTDNTNSKNNDNDNAKAVQTSKVIHKPKTLREAIELGYIRRSTLLDVQQFNDRYFAFEPPVFLGRSRQSDKELLKKPKYTIVDYIYIPEDAAMKSFFLANGVPEPRGDGHGSILNIQNGNIHSVGVGVGAASARAN